MLQRLTVSAPSLCCRCCCRERQLQPAGRRIHRDTGSARQGRHPVHLPFTGTGQQHGGHRGAGWRRDGQPAGQPGGQPAQRWPGCRRAGHQPQPCHHRRRQHTDGRRGPGRVRSHQHGADAGRTRGTAACTGAGRHVPGRRRASARQPAHHAAAAAYAYDEKTGGA